MSLITDGNYSSHSVCHGICADRSSENRLSKVDRKANSISRCDPASKGGTYKPVWGLKWSPIRFILSSLSDLNNN